MRTRTSAPGSSEPRGPRARGYTLLELLVVLAILGVVTAGVSLSIAPVESRRVDEEAARLAALFRLAQDESRVTGREVAWRADATGYRFLVDGREPAGDDPLRPRAWPFPVRGVDAPELRFGREPLLDPVTIRVTMADRTLVIALDAFGQPRPLP